MSEKWPLMFLRATSKSVAMFFTSGPAAREGIMTSPGRFSANTIGTNPFQGGGGGRGRDGSNSYNQV